MKTECVKYLAIVILLITLFGGVGCSIHGIYERDRSASQLVYSNDSLQQLMISPDAVFPIFHIQIYAFKDLSFRKQWQGDSPQEIRNSKGELVHNMGDGKWRMEGDTIYLKLDGFNHREFPFIIRGDSLISTSRTWQLSPFTKK